MKASLFAAARPPEISAWERWLHHPESLWIHHVLFQIHLWIGMGTSGYLFFMSISGSAIVFRNDLENSANPNSRVFRVVEWLVDFHANLLLGDKGRWLNGIGATSLALLCLTGVVIWWPGVKHWRRSLTVNWRSSFARINWDLHNMLGFSCFLFWVMWGVSGAYFCFPQPFNTMVDILNHGSTSLGFGDVFLMWLSNFHFGRFDLWTEALWAVLGLALAILTFTGMFMCCHRLFIRKGAPLPR